MKKNKFKKRVTFVTIFVLVVSVIWFVIGIGFTKCNGPYSICIFADISECQAFELDAGAEIKHLDDSKDTKLKGLEYKQKYLIEYDSDDMQFKLFAYEFESQELAQKYFKNCTSKDTNGKHNFSGSTNMISYDLEVVYENFAYRIDTKARCSSALNKKLEQIFSIKITTIGDW